MKKQRRLLVDTRYNLWKEYESENREKVSYSLFCKLQPFYVVDPSEADRDTCLCKIHANMAYMANALKTKRVVESSDGIFSRLCTREGLCSWKVRSL